MNAAALDRARKVVIFGTGSLSELLLVFLTEDNGHDVVAFTVTQDRLTGDTHLGRPLVAFEKVSERYPPGEHAMFVAVGYGRMNAVRSHFYAAAKSRGYELITYVSPRAMYRGDPTALGDNCCIFDGAVVEPFATIGSDVIVWSGAHVSHHSSIGDHSFLAPRATVAGHTSVGSHCFLGVNCTVRDGVTVADECLIGAGATILRDTAPRQVYAAPRATLRAGDVSEHFG